ncbi:hypothetical protein F5B20DRAFT_497541 [Whalleya microplaca]|nr:hypothetical protein F5B20DRAFT_497541 [Whalleya microplaca]
MATVSAATASSTSLLNISHVATVAKSSNFNVSRISDLDIDMQYVKSNNEGVAPSHAELFGNHPDFLDLQRVIIRDAREAEHVFSFPDNGFQWSKFNVPQIKDYEDKQQVSEKYLPVLEQFVKEQLGASFVKAFSHKVRNKTYNPSATDARSYSGPALRPHVDITSKFAPLLLRYQATELFKKISEENKHWQIINAWRPIKTVRRDPLVVADATSVALEDHLLVPSPEVGPGVEGWFLKKPSKEHSKHSWWYLNEQTPEEVLLFRQYDSEGSPVVPHTAISFPGPVPDEARESIEVRMIVVY